ncbi:Tn3 family transposase [Nocardia sp. 2YAB30]|uniref:Tn3 family transposase n=1 Tax=unclassified Nocardia TaxID=2637762 RepID=UPI003F9E8E3A
MSLDEDSFLTARQVALYGRFGGPPSEEELERFFVLDDADRKLIAKRRDDSSRLGFALQLTTVRFLGTFLADPIDVPLVVVEYLAEQLGIADVSCVKTYVRRDQTRLEHRWEIARVDGWGDYADFRELLRLHVDRRAWTTGDGRNTIFDGALAWLRHRRVLLPAMSTLERLIGQVVTAAETRLFDTLLGLITAEQARLLLALLDVGDGERVSALERLRKGQIDTTAKALVAALGRVAAVAGIGLGEVDLSVVPRRRVIELAKYGRAATATTLRGKRYPKKLGILLATVVWLQAKATDDALELFDVVMTHELLARAQRRTDDDRIKRYPRVSRDASRLAAAVAVLLEAREWGEDVTLTVVWDAIENVVSRAELHACVANINAVIPPGTDPDGEWRSVLMTRYPLVRKFLRRLVETIEFGASTDAAPILAAFTALPDLLDAGPTKRVPAGYLDARKVDVDIVPAGWRVQVFREGRPEATVDRNGYVFCVLHLFHQRLKRRDIFAAASAGWADPRAQLLSAPVWESKREALLDELQLPEDPGDLLAGYAEQLDATWRYMAARAAAGALSVDAEGRVHTAALEAIDAPATLIELRNRCKAMMPRVDIGDLILEVMGWHPGFVASYTHLSGGEPRLGDLPVTVAAVLTAQALNVGWGPVITPGVAAVSKARISHVYQNYVRAETHAAANSHLIAGQAGIATAQLWGGGLVAAVDGTRFVVPVRSNDARPNPKYFDRRKGATLLNMINDQAVGSSAMVLSGTPKDSLYAVDLMYRRDGGRRPEVLISDTGSYSDMVFGLLKLLGVDYRPELADLPDQKLWRVDQGADYGLLDPAARGKIDLTRVARHWPDILRIVGSVHDGAVAASDVMRMLQHGGNPTQLGIALAHFGRIFKTLHVLSYVDAEPYRRDIKRMRNLQEERHGLGKHVFHGRKGELREAYHAGMEDQLGALGLVIGCITLWNTVYLDRILTQLRESGHEVRDEDVARLHPYLYAHINVHGHYAFSPPDPDAAIRPLRDPAADED